MNAKTNTSTGCLCGCKFATINPTANYRPGHDASHVSNLLGALASKTGGFSQDDVDALKVQLPSPALRVKFQTAADKLMERRAAKALKGAMKIAKNHGVWLDVDHTVAKVGRWTYPIQEWVIVTKTGDQPTGKFQRNTKRDGTGEWVEIENADELVDVK